MDASVRPLSRRQNEIISLLRASGRVTVEELTALFTVSPQTIRSEARVINGVHGGAIVETCA